MRFFIFVFTLILFLPFGFSQAISEENRIYDSLEIAGNMEPDVWEALAQKAFKTNNYDVLGSSIHNIGYIYNREGKLLLALKYYLRALSVFESANDQEGIAGEYNDIAGVYQEIDELELCLDYRLKSLEIYEHSTDTISIARSAHNLANLYMDLDSIDLAFEYELMAFDLVEQVHDTIGLFYIGSGLARMYLANDDREKYEQYVREIYPLSQVPATFFISDFGKTNFALFYLRKYEWEKNPVYLDSVDYLMNSIDTTSIWFDDVDIITEFYNVKLRQCELTEEWEGYYFWNKKIKQFESEIEETSNSNDILKERFEFENEISKVKNEEKLAREKLKSAEEKAQQSLIIYFLLGLGLLLIVFGIIVYRRWKESNKQKEIIELQKELVDEKNIEITDSINYAKRIQSSIFPTAEKLRDTLKDGFVLYLPKDIVAGDFYWLEEVKGGVFFASADCTGHGVPGAMVSLLCNNALNRSVREFGLNIPGEILDKTRELVLAEFELSEEAVNDGMDISLAFLNNERTKLLWSGANNPLWLIRNGEIQDIKGDKQPVGLYHEMKPFKTHEIDLQKGDRIYLMTDGFQDQFGGEKAKKFKPARLKKVLLESHLNEMEVQKATLLKTVNDWRGSLEQVDDICLIGVCI